MSEGKVENLFQIINDPNKSLLNRIGPGEGATRDYSPLVGAC